MDTGNLHPIFADLAQAMASAPRDAARIEYESGLKTMDWQYEWSDDGNVYRLGLQYVVPFGTNVLAFRAGAWRDPDHRIRFTGKVLPTDDANTAAAKAAQILLFRPGKNEYHYTGGLGFTLGEHLQLDAAADISTSVRTGALSAVVRY